MSAYCNLAGLYPPEGTQVWSTDIKWQPIPVHTRSYDMDPVSSTYRGFIKESRCLHLFGDLFWGQLKDGHDAFS